MRIGETRLVFYPHEKAKTVRVTIIDDKLIEETEAFGVKLIVPDHHIRNGVKLGNPSVAVVYIKDGMLYHEYCYWPIHTKIVFLQQMTSHQPPCPLLSHPHHIHLKSLVRYLYFVILPFVDLLNLITSCYKDPI